jgi:hypothetical protein
MTGPEHSKNWNRNGLTAAGSGSGFRDRDRDRDRYRGGLCEQRARRWEENRARGARFFLQRHHPIPPIPIPRPIPIPNPRSRSRRFYLLSVPDEYVCPSSFVQRDSMPCVSALFDVLSVPRTSEPALQHGSSSRLTECDVFRGAREPDSRRAQPIEGVLSARIGVGKEIVARHVLAVTLSNSGHRIVPLHRRAADRLAVPIYQSAKRLHFRHGSRWRCTRVGRLNEDRLLTAAQDGQQKQ